MARYDIESDVKFGQEQFDTARKYKSDQAKQQEKFAKNLFAFDTAVQGLNLLVNNAGKENDEKQLPKKAAYNNILKRTENIRNDENLRLQSGMGVEDYLEKKYFDLLNTEASTTFPQLSPAQYSKALRLEAKNLAIANAPEYQQMIKLSMEMPEFENFDEYYKQASGTPRSIGEWATKGVKRLFSKETPETIKIKNNKASDALYGTEMFDKFETLSSSLKAYDDVTNKGLDAVKIINKLNLKSGGLNEALSKQESKTILDEVSGTKTEITIFYGATNKLDGSGVEYRPENTVIMDKRVSRTDDNLATLSEVNNLYTISNKEAHVELGKILSNSDGRPTFQQYQKAREYLANNTEQYSINWQDEASKERAFPTWYSSQIIGVRNKDGKLIARDLDQDGIYSIDPDFQDDAIKLGLDEKTLKEKYSKLGIDASPEILDEDELILKTRTNLSTLIPNDFKDNYASLLNEVDSDFYEMMAIKLKRDQDKNIVDLGTLNLGVVFPNMGIKGRKRLYFNRETQELFY